MVGEDFIVVIIGVEGERIPDSTLMIVSLFAGGVTEFGVEIVDRNIPTL